MKKQLKPVKTLIFNELKLTSTDLYFSKIKNLNNRKLDFDVFLPSKGVNLQREKVWNLDQKRELIISILIERNIPNICAISLIDYNDERGGDIIQIIDGKQRLTTMIDFINDGFTVILEDEEFLFSELPDDYKFKINHYEIRGQLAYDQYGQSISDNTKINWFKAINFFGSPQEISHLNKLI